MISHPQCSALVVEDDPVVRLDLVNLLQEEGFTTYEAGTAREAIALLEQHSDVRAVFSDIEMPGNMDGLALAHYVRYRWPPTVIVISSGQIRPTRELMPERTDFLAKPYHREELSRVCREIGKRLRA